MNTQKYDNVDVELIQSSGLFDIEWYKLAYPEVSQSGLNPIEHYLTIGAQQKKHSGPNFDTGFYLEQNPDVAKSGINPLVHYIKFGRAEGRLAMNTGAYNHDGLRTIHNSEFMTDERFVSAYQRGMQAADGDDYKWYWRVHIGMWAARTAIKLPGDFVECGVNVGFMSSAIMHDLDWNSSNRNFYLLDTFNGIYLEQTLKEERDEGIEEKNQEMIDSNFYVSNSESVRENFKQWKGVKIIEGVIPHTLNEIDTDKIAFLHLDMNCAPPEVAAFEYIWPKLVRGAIILMDDYAYYSYHNQKYALDRLAQKLGFDIVSLPTGQGLAIKT